MRAEKYIEDKKKLVDKALDLYLPSLNTKPKIIHKAMRYAVFSGGKRIRGVLTIAGFEACNGIGSKILPAAAAIELIHSYTLIHDDLPCMDDDDFRRGKPSCHKKFGEAIALLAGDALLTLAFEVISKSKDIDIVKETAGSIGTYGTIGGQVADIMLHAAKRPVLKREIGYISKCKTAMLFELAVKLGGMVQDVDKARINALSKFGRDIGMAFQLVDDLIDGDGYVKIYGKGYAVNKAISLTKTAKSYLSIFGGKADRLIEIADLMAGRRV